MKPVKESCYGEDMNFQSAKGTPMYVAILVIAAVLALVGVSFAFKGKVHF